MWLEELNDTYNLFFPYPIPFDPLAPHHPLFRIQTMQNSALRIATGCIIMTSIDHLHEETEMLSFFSMLLLRIYRAVF